MLFNYLMDIWSVCKDDRKFDEDINQSDLSTITRILKKKLELFGVKIYLPYLFLEIISELSRGNPGISQIILKLALLQIPVDRKTSEVKYEDVCRFLFVLYYSQGRTTKALYRQWDLQKDEGRNRCDTTEWWSEAITKFIPCDELINQIYNY